MKLILAALAGFVLGWATAWLTDTAEVQRSRRMTFPKYEDPDIVAAWLSAWRDIERVDSV